MAKKKRGPRKEKDTEAESSGSESTPAPTPKKRSKEEKEEKPTKGKYKKGRVKEEPKEPEEVKPKHNIDLSQPYSLPLSELRDTITCSLCKGYLIDATTVVECLHSFCKSCLLQYFEEQDNNCPDCGQLIHQSHPTHYISLDRTLQDMVYKIVPGLYEKEAKARADFIREQKKAAGEDVEEEERRLEEKQKELEKDITNRCFEGRTVTSHHRTEPQMLIELIPGIEGLPPIEKRFIRTGEMCTITTLKRYLSLAMYGTKSRYMELDLFCNNELMGRDFSMKFILKTRCRRIPIGAPLKLVYKQHIDF